MKDVPEYPTKPRMFFINLDFYLTVIVLSEAMFSCQGFYSK